jgi:cell division protein FtsZ
MTINLHLPTKSELLRPTITVIGVGGAGGNAVNNMIASNLEGVNFVVANTDAQALDHSLTDRIIQLGAGLTKGLGAGANPEVGRGAAEEAREEIAAYIEGSNMVFITAGMGGGTGTGAASVVARIAREQGILTIGVVTKPFQFEGSHRMRMAEAGLKELQEFVDTLIVIPNQNLFRVANERTTFADAFRMADEVLHSGVRGVTDLMVKPGLINLDFADIRTVMREMGKAMMGTGEATGERRAIEAAEAAISNPLLDDVSLKGARAVLINITGGADMTLFEADEAANRIREEVDSEANIIFGSTFNDSMEGRMRVSVVATGIDAISQVSAPPATQKYAPSVPASERKPYSLAHSAAAPKPVEAPKPVQQAPQRPTTNYDQPARHYVDASPIVTVHVRTPQESPRHQAAPVRQPRPEPVAQAQVAVAEEPAPRVRYQEPEPQQELYREQEQDEVMVEEEIRSLEREPASEQVEYERPVERPMERLVAAPQRRDVREEAKGLLQRFADVGRALSRNDGRPETSEPRVHVVQKSPEAQQAAPKAGDDQYLDIPAFLRRQAN